jgi:hypothetical protein
MLCLGVCILTVYGTEYLKLPKIVARFTNARTLPNLHSATMRDLFETEAKTPGWDKREFDWDWFIEIKVANDSETPVTIEDVKYRLRVGKEIKTATLSDDLDSFLIDKGYDATLTPRGVGGHERYIELESFMRTIRKQPIEKGRGGYRGWMHFKVEKVSQGDINRAKLAVWLIDELDRKYTVDYKKGDDQRWDNTFSILEKVENH